MEVARSLVLISGNEARMYRMGTNSFKTLNFFERCFVNLVFFIELALLMDARYGITRVLEGGDLLEKAAANVSIVRGHLSEARAKAGTNSFISIQGMPITRSVRITYSSNFAVELVHYNHLSLPTKLRTFIITFNYALSFEMLYRIETQPI